MATNRIRLSDGTVLLLGSVADAAFLKRSGTDLVGISAATLAGLLSHNSLAGLTTGDPHTQYALLAGRSGGQTIKGGTGTGEGLVFFSNPLADGNIFFYGYNLHFEGGLYDSSYITPAQLTADQNDYSPTGRTYSFGVLLTSDANRTITGMTNGSGQFWLLCNVGSNPIVLADESVSSIAGNRFALPADVTIPANGVALVWYDPSSGRNRVLLSFHTTSANTWTQAQTFINSSGIKIQDTDASHTLGIIVGSDLTADRTLTIVTGDANRTFTISGDATVSGNNTGNQTITLTGDVTGSGTGSFAATIANDAVTYGKMQNCGARSIICRAANSSGDLAELQATANYVLFCNGSNTLVWATVNDILDAGLGSTRGSIPYRGASQWTSTSPGTSGYVWTSNGAGADPTWQAASSVSAATQAEEETASSTTVYTSPGRQQYHPGVAKGWVRFNGTGTIAVDVSRNLDGVTPLVDNGTGNYTVNWGTDFSSANYCVQAAVHRNTSGNHGTCEIDPSGSNPAAGSVKINCTGMGGTSAADMDQVHVVAFGDQ